MLETRVRFKRIISSFESLRSLLRPIKWYLQNYESRLNFFRSISDSESDLVSLYPVLARLAPSPYNRIQELALTAYCNSLVSGTPLRSCNQSMTL